MTDALDVLGTRVVHWMLATGTRQGERDDPRHSARSHTLRTVVFVSGSMPQAHSVDALLLATSDYDVIFVESIAHSYSCINRVLPDLVIISSDVDDVATCQLLSMLRADRRSSGIPVLNCPTCCDPNGPGYDLAELDEDTAAPSLAAPMN
jgi:hypothetical protein